MRRILLVEDDEDIRSNIQDYFQGCAPDIEVHAVSEGFDGLLAAARDPAVSCLVLDLGLPDLDGVEVCRRLRSMGWKKSILMLTARDALEDRIKGLEAGADDYIVKPFSLAELLARVRAALRREEGQTGAILAVGDLILNTETHEVMRAGKRIDLTATGYKILEVLMRKSPAIVDREELARKVWPTTLPTAENIRSHLYLLRNAVDKPFAVQLLHTLPGTGWCVRKECRAKEHHDL